MSPEEILFIKAIEAAKDEVFEAHLSAETSAEISAETPNVKFGPASPTRKADALTVKVESFLAHGENCGQAGELDMKKIKAQARQRSGA